MILIFRIVFCGVIGMVYFEVFMFWDVDLSKVLVFEVFEIVRGFRLFEFYDNRDMMVYYDIDLLNS